MMRIDRIRMVLPARLHTQAQRIATGVADNLAASGPHPAVRVASLRVPVIRIAANAGVQEIAERTAHAILHQLRHRHGRDR